MEENEEFKQLFKNYRTLQVRCEQLTEEIRANRTEMITCANSMIGFCDSLNQAVKTSTLSDSEKQTLETFTNLLNRHRTAASFYVITKNEEERKHWQLFSTDNNQGMMYGYAAFTSIDGDFMPAYLWANTFWETALEELLKKIVKVITSTSKKFQAHFSGYDGWNNWFRVYEYDDSCEQNFKLIETSVDD